VSGACYVIFPQYNKIIINQAALIF
jgi:hypothetical protein